MILGQDDFPLAQVGNLIMSPTRSEPVLVCDCVAVARQVARVLNYQARSESRLFHADDWLKLQ
jgi:hypothetical protein